MNKYVLTRKSITAQATSICRNKGWADAVKVIRQLDNEWGLYVLKTFINGDYENDDYTTEQELICLLTDYT